MAQPQTLLLHDGDLASLVALAREMTAETRQGLTLVHFRTAQPGADTRRKHVHRQAERFRATRTVEIELPHLGKPAPLGGPSARTVTDQAQMLLIAVNRAVELEAARIVWPVCSGGDIDLAARATELTLTALQIAELQHRPSPDIDTPLADLSWRQVIEVGLQLSVPFEMAWTCESDGPDPCRGCETCRTIKRAFDEAGVMHPAAALAAGRR